MVELSALEALELVERHHNSPDFVIMDVRTPEEFAAGHLKGAVLLPCGPGFAASLAEYDKQSTYLVYCRSGGRSLSAVEEMEKQGFAKVFMLAGGISAWQSKGMPIEI